jgi:hypothetical protein
MKHAGNQPVTGLACDFDPFFNRLERRAYIERPASMDAALLRDRGDFLFCARFA